MSLAQGKIQKLVNSYANAFVAIAIENKTLDIIEKELFKLKDIFVNISEIKVIFRSPIINKSDKMALSNTILSILKLSETTINFCKVLANNDRLYLIPLIADKIALIHYEIKGEARMEVVSYTKLTTKELNKIQEKFEQILKKKVTIITSIDTSILGGFIVKVGSKLLDISLKNELENIGLLTKIKFSENY